MPNVFTIWSTVKNPRSAIDIRNRPGIPIPDEDPYSIAGSGSSGGSSGNGNGVRDRERSRPNKEPRPPELPPRDGGAQYGTKANPRVIHFSLILIKWNWWYNLFYFRHKFLFSIYSPIMNTWKNRDLGNKKLEESIKKVWLLLVAILNYHFEWHNVGYATPC